MDLINIGKLVNTHGLKGEVRILSTFKYKDKVFKINNKIYINNNPYIIKSYRPHKNFDMVTLDKIENIDDALKLKGYSVYVNRNDYDFGILNTDLIGLDVYDNEIYKGKIVDVMELHSSEVIVVDGIKRHMVPLNENFVKNIDMNNKKIYINYIKGLDNED